jgi:hypothetical protein
MQARLLATAGCPFLLDASYPFCVYLRQSATTYGPEEQKGSPMPVKTAIRAGVESVSKSATQTVTQSHASPYGTATSTVTVSSSVSYTIS